MGLPDGRWVDRQSGDGEPSHVLIVQVMQGARPSRRQRSIRSAPAPSTLTLTRVTVVDALHRELDRTGRIDDAIATVERALHTQARAGDDRRALLSAPPWIGLRIGTGSGEQLADGDWLDAEEIPPPQASRDSRRKAEPTKGNFARILGGKGSEDDVAALDAAADLVQSLREALKPRG